MLSEDYGILMELLEELKRETEEAKISIDANLRHIQKADAYVNDLVSSESEDFKVFSPRRVEVLHKEELQEARQRRLACVQENERLAARKELLEGRICRLEALLAVLEQETLLREQVKGAKKFQTETIGRLKGLADKIDESSSHIDRNPIQARQDFAIIGKTLRKLAEGMKDGA